MNEVIMNSGFKSKKKLYLYRARKEGQHGDSDWI